MYLLTEEGRAGLIAQYRDSLLSDVIPFWLRYGLDRVFGGYLTSLDRDGAVVDTDKSIWFQGRGAWMFATLYLDVEPREEWLEAARSGVEFLRRYGADANGKHYFTVAREGTPLRMRRYVYSESFASIAYAAFHRATGESEAAEQAVRCFEKYLWYSFEPGVMAPKTVIGTRPSLSIGPHMISMVTAQEIRKWLGDITVQGKTCSAWIDWSLEEIRSKFLNHAERAVMETVGVNGEVLNHFDGRQLNPGHAIECAWFVMREGQLRDDRQLIQLGCQMLDWMWERGWDPEFGGLFYFRDLRGLPVQEYWHDMKFWWPHCEAIIATLLAWSLTGEAKYATWHQQVHDWSFRNFPDPEFGEWFGYLHRDGRKSNTLKGSLWKGPFHLPRMLHTSWSILASIP
ncbi:AGE family epimerase/isomerase [Pirellulaceae bacterium SH467]|jgi:N-acylglucosamine 2-epimerase